MPWEKNYNETDVLERAMHAFWAHGYEGTTMNDLVAATGINRGSIYAAYTSKHSLFMEALLHYDRIYRQEFLDGIAREHAPKDAILAAFDKAAGQCGTGKTPGGCLLVNTVLELSPHDGDVRDFIDASLRVTAPLGFTAENTLACVGACRDEMCQPFVADVHDAWGDAFLLAGLGGMLFCGRTGLQAAHSHAPVHGRRERYAYICMPHIGIGPAGEPGHCQRPTRPGEASGACGALIALQRQLEQGQVETKLDRADLEQSLLTRRLVGELEPGQVPDLVELTKLACTTIGVDLECAIEDTVDTRKADYCVFTGVQIHAPDGSRAVWPAVAYAVVDGERRDFDLHGESRP